MSESEHPLLMRDIGDLTTRMQSLVNQWHESNIVQERGVIKLEQLTKEVHELREDLKADYVGRTEFEILKVEHDQIKKLTWGFIAMVLTAVVGAIIALVFKG